jgi:hypothetical protein
VHEHETGSQYGKSQHHHQQPELPHTHVTGTVLGRFPIMAALPDRAEDTAERPHPGQDGAPEQPGTTAMTTAARAQRRAEPDSLQTWGTEAGPGAGTAWWRRERRPGRSTGGSCPVPPNLDRVPLNFDHCTVCVAEG